MGDAKVVLKYRAVIDQPLDKEMHHVPPAARVLSPHACPWLCTSVAGGPEHMCQQDRLHQVLRILSRFCPEVVDGAQVALCPVRLEHLEGLPHPHRLEWLSAHGR